MIPNFNLYFFFGLLAGVAIITYFIFAPFLTAIVAAAILAALFQKPYLRLVRHFRGHKPLASLVVCFFVVVMIITPLFLTLGLMVGSVNDVFSQLTTGGELTQTVRDGVVRLREIPLIKPFLREDTFNPGAISQDIERVGKAALGLLQATYSSIADFVLWVFVTFFTLYYFLIDGDRLVRYIKRLSPMQDRHEDLLIRRLMSINRATLKGTLVVGIVQGTIGGVAFAIAGVPSPIIWGVLMVFFSMIPMIGPGIIWLPIGLIQLFLGNYWQGIFIILVGLFVISIIDNILRAKLVGHDTQMHPLMVFFATLGGIAFFGLPGLLIGPMIISLCMALWEIYASEFKTELDEFNSSDMSL